MGTLTALVDGLASGAIEVVDLTAPLSADTPIIQLPPEFGQTEHFALEEISRYDERGPAWYWNNFRSGEHTGTHFDAPNHWVTGKDSDDVASVPARRLIAPAVVLDFSARAADDADFLLEVEDIKGWEQEHGPLPEGGWLLYRTGWDARSAEQEAFLNADQTGPHTPGISAECARWLAEEAPVIGLGVETVGTDAGTAHSFDPPFPCHSYLLGSGKYGLTQLQRLAELPPTGAVDHRGTAAHRHRLGQPGPCARPRRAMNDRAMSRVRVVRASERQRASGAELSACVAGERNERGRGRRADAGRTRCPPGVRRRRLRQLPCHQRSRRQRRAVRRGASRERRGDDGRRVRPHERHGRGGVGAPGLWADQRDDRHHRGRQEPHAAARPRRGGDVAPVELLRRPAGAGRRRRRRADAGDVARVGRERSCLGVLDGVP